MEFVWQMLVIVLVCEEANGNRDFHRIRWRRDFDSNKGSRRNCRTPNVDYAVAEELAEASHS